MYLILGRRDMIILSNIECASNNFHLRSVIAQLLEIHKVAAPAANSCIMDISLERTVAGGKFSNNFSLTFIEFSKMHIFFSFMLYIHIPEKLGFM